MSYYNSLIEKYEKALEVKPDSINAVINLARLYLKIQDIDKSISFYEALIDPMPKNVEVFKSMGVLYLAKNEKREAMKYIKKALKLDLKEPTLYEYAAEIDYKKADECYDIAIDIHSSNKMSEVRAMHCFMIAMRLYKRYKYEISLRYLNIITKHMGDTVEYRNLLGSVYYKLGKYDEALEQYSMACDLLGYVHHNVAVNMSACYKRKGQFEFALKCLTSAIELSDNPEQLYYYIALIYLVTGDKINSIYNLKQALDINENYALAKELYHESIDNLSDSIDDMEEEVSMLALEEEDFDMSLEDHFALELDKYMDESDSDNKSEDLQDDK